MNKLIFFNLSEPTTEKDTFAYTAPRKLLRHRFSDLFSLKQKMEVILEKKKKKTIHKNNNNKKLPIG